MDAKRQKNHVKHRIGRSKDSNEKASTKPNQEADQMPSNAVRKAKHSKGLFSGEQNTPYQMNIDRVLAQNSVDWKTRLKIIEYGQQRKEVGDLDTWCDKNT